jgi:Serine/threonine protein phosphatase
MKRIKLKSVLKYAAYFLLLLLLSSTETSFGARPFALGLFVALVYARQNILVLTPLYIAAAVIAEPQWMTLLASVIPPAVFVTAYFVHCKTGRAMNVRFMNLYALLAGVPSAFLAANGRPLFSVILGIIIAQIFVYTTTIIVYAIIIRGLKYRFVIDELVSGAVFLAVCALSLSKLVPFGISVYAAVLCFLLLLSAYNFQSVVPLVTGAVFGLGASFAVGSVEALGVAVCLSLAVVAFKNTHIALSAASLVVTDIVLGFYFEVYDGYGWHNIVAVAVPALIFVALPARFKRFAGSASAVGERQASRTIVNRERQDISGRLFSIATIFEDMQKILEGDLSTVPDTRESRQRLAKDIALGYCAKCPDCDACFTSLGDDTSGILVEILEAAEAKGKASIIDMPPFMTSRCRRINGLITAINERISGYKNYMRLTKSLDTGKLMLAAQMGGMAEILENLGNDIKQCVSFDVAREKQIIDELTYRSVMCREAIVYGDDNDISVSVVVRAEDADKTVLPKAISRAMRIPMITEGAPDVHAGYASLRLIPAPKFDIVYGESMRRREGENRCGDTVSVQKIGEKKAVLAVCDGMGSGEAAEQYSEKAIQLIENFYRAGFANEVVLALVNKLLVMKNDESFSALTICVIDLAVGACDIIKLGAPYNAVIRRDNVEITEGHALPIGIVEGVKPSISRRLLTNGDSVVLLSDGVTDVLTEAELSAFLMEKRSGNPKALAEEIIAYAAEKGATDDATALVARVFGKI